MAQSKAWLLELGDEYRAAVGNQHMVEYLVTSETEIMPVPLAPDYSPGVMVWREQIIPVIDLLRLLNPGFEHSGDISGVMVLAYQETPGTPLKHGALALRAAPQNIQVHGDTACAIPATPAIWRELAIASFSDQEEAIPILNAQRVFSSGIRSIYQDSLAVADEQAIPETVAEMEPESETETASLNKSALSPDDLAPTPDQGNPLASDMQEFLETVDAVLKTHSSDNGRMSLDPDPIDQTRSEMQQDVNQRQNIPETLTESGAGQGIPSPGVVLTEQSSEEQQLSGSAASTPSDLIESGYVDSVSDSINTLGDDEDLAADETRDETISGKKISGSRWQRFRGKYGPGRKKITKAHRRFGQRRG